MEMRAKSEKEPPIQAVARSGVATSRRTWDAWLWGVAGAMLGLLMTGWWQRPSVRWGTPSLAERFLSPWDVFPQARLPLLPKADVHALWFFDANEGLAAGESGTLLKTGDGGRTWTRAAMPRHVYSRGINALIFDAKTGRGVLGGNGGLVMATNDRGATWVDDGVLERVPAVAEADVHAIAVDPQANAAHFATSKGLAGYVGGGGAGFVLEERADAVVAIRDGLAWLGPGGVAIVGLDGRGATKAPASADAGGVSMLAARDGRMLIAGPKRIAWLTVPAIERSYPQQQQVKGTVQTAAASSPSSLVIEAESDLDGTEFMAVTMTSGSDAWLVDRAGGIFRAALLERGRASVEQVGSLGRALYALWVFSDREVIVAGEDGAMFKTRDAGATWEPLTRNCWPEEKWASLFALHLPAPWCWVGLVALSGLGWARWRRLPPVIEERDAIAGELASDRPLAPGEIDRLNFQPLVQGLSAYLRNTATQAPLTLAVTGAWGVGKSSFMNLLRGDLEKRGLCAVWFNAWHHQQEPQILAPLLQAIKDEATPPLVSERFEVALRFRWRLFWQRVSSQRSLLLVVFVLACLGAGVGHAVEWQLPFAALSDGLLGLGDSKTLVESVGRVVGGSSFVGTVVGLLVFVWRALSTIGVKPSALLATESGKSSAHALTAQATFRREFSAQFREVTNALKPYPLVIFIDDLDRCEVGKVFQILEAINYIVSSGDCFVVLGMSEERVRDCVALGFKDLPVDFAEADEREERAGEGKPENMDEAVPTDARREERATETWATQRRFAQHYLEKLVQLRVEVPRGNAKTAQHFVALRSVADQPDGKAQGAFVAGGASVGAGGGAFGRWLRARKVAAIATGLVAVSGASAFLLGHLLAPVMPQQPAAGTGDGVRNEKSDTNGIGAGAGQATGGAAAAPAGNAVAGGAGANAQAKAPVEARFRERGLGTGATEPGSDGRWTRVVGGLAAVTVLLTAWVAQRNWQRRREVVTRDTFEFKEATVRWGAALYVLLGSRLTPRVLKRFKNRARYYAMMRATSGPTFPLHGLSDAGLVVLAALEQADLVVEGAPPRLDLERLKRSALSVALQSEAIDSFGALASDREAGEEYTRVAQALQRA